MKDNKNTDIGSASEKEAIDHDMNHNVNTTVASIAATTSEAMKLLVEMNSGTTQMTADTSRVLADFADSTAQELSSLKTQMAQMKVFLIGIYIIALLLCLCMVYFTRQSTINADVFKRQANFNASQAGFNDTTTHFLDNLNHRLDNLQPPR